MADRVLPVTAYTTLDLVDAEVEGHGWTATAPAVVNVAGDDRVLLELELDNVAVDLSPHADRLRLSPDEARTLATALLERADAAEE